MTNRSSIRSVVSVSTHNGRASVTLPHFPSIRFQTSEANIEGIPEAPDAGFPESPTAAIGGFSNEHFNANPNIQKEGLISLKSMRQDIRNVWEDLSSEMPEHICSRITYKTALLIFFVVQAIYSIINLIRETIEDGWNANAAIYLIIGIVLGLVGACWLLKDTYRLARDCRQGINQFLGRSDELTNVRGNHDGLTEQCNKMCKCCPTIAIPVLFRIFEEILLYSSLIVTLVEFIHLEDYRLESAWNYIDCVILGFTVITEAIVPRVYYVIWLRGRKNILLKKVSQMQTYRYYTPLRLTPIFATVLVLMQMSMIGCITLRLIADNTRRQYQIHPFTWVAIFCGILIPFLSVATYFIINQYWIWQPLIHLRNRDPQNTHRNVDVEGMTDRDKWIGYAFDPSAWTIMVTLFLTFIAFAVTTSGFDYDNTLSDDKTLSAVYYTCYSMTLILFLAANIQTIAFILFIIVQPCLGCLPFVKGYRRLKYCQTNITNMVFSTKAVEAQEVHY